MELALSQPLPEIATLLAGAAASDPFATPDLEVAELRSLCDAGVLAHLALVREARPLHDVRDLVSPGGVRVRLYLPTAEPEALHIHLHGGGWWMGSIETADPVARELATGLRMAVLSMDYPLAP